MYSFTATGALKATESFICDFFSKMFFFFFFQIIFGLLSVDMRSWTEHLVQSTSFEMRDLIPGSDYGISIQSVLGTDVSRAVIKELSTRKRHDCTWRKTSSVVVGSCYERYVFHYLLVMCLEPVNELSEIKKINKKKGCPLLLQPALNLWMHNQPFVMSQWVLIVLPGQWQHRSLLHLWREAFFFFF